MDGCVMIGRQTSPDWISAPTVETKLINLALQGDGAHNRAIADAIAQARARVRCLVGQLPTSLRAIRLVTARRVTRAIDRFTGDVIARMVVICSLLRRLTDS